MEEISRESGSPFWFHVQPMKDRGLLRSLLDRALALQSPVLIFTVDWPIPSQNHRNIRNRLGQHTARGLVQVLSRPRWAFSMAKSGRDRKSVVLGKSVSVRLDSGGGRHIKKKKQKI